MCQRRARIPERDVLPVPILGFLGNAWFGPERVRGLGGGQEGGQQQGGGRPGAAAGPAPQPPPPGARPALVGSRGAPLALSHTCAVARRLGLSCNTSVARARMVFYFLAAPSLSLEVGEGWHLVSLLRRPQPRGLCSVIHSLPGPGFREAGRQGASGGSSRCPHLGKVILKESGDFRLDKMVDPREDVEGEAGRAPRSLASEQPGDGHGVGMGPGFGLASGFTHRFLVFPKLQCLPHTFPAAHPSVHHLHCLFTLFLLYIDPV